MDTSLRFFMYVYTFKSPLAFEISQKSLQAKCKPNTSHTRKPISALKVFDS